MSEKKVMEPADRQNSLRYIRNLAAVALIASLPVCLFGWKGILSTAWLLIAGVFVVRAKWRIAVAMATVLAVGQFLYPAINPALPAIHRTDCQNNLRKLTQAIHEYESVHGHFPPPYLTDAEGTPIHSWRVILLPFLGEQELYDQIDKNRPWNDPANIPFHDQMPQIYGCPAVRYQSRWYTTGNTTAYVVVTGRETAWNPERQTGFNQITDGVSSTIAIIESERHRAPWMSPEAPDFVSFVESIDFTDPHSGSLSYSTFDGSAHSLYDNEYSHIELMLTASNGD